jgi:pyrroline-5-carboxylate reductase
MRAVGVAVWLEDERRMDVVTGLSGSGPAYFFYLMECLEEAASARGLDAATARLLTVETALGAARLALESDEAPGELRRRVTSPGGTTERGIEALDEGRFRETVERAVGAASDRSAELAEELESMQ